MPPKFLTVSDLAELFQKDEETIRRWIKERDVFPHAFKVKDGWYVPLKDIKNLMKKNSDAQTPEETKETRVPRQSSGFVTGWK